MIFLDFLGKKIDDKTLEKLKGILNSPEGQKLKNELSKTDTKDLLEKLKGVDLSGIDMKDISNKIDNTDKKEIIGKLKDMNSKLFKNGR